MSAAFYLGSIVLGNILVHSLGLVTVFGMTFPAGAVAIGITFSARDFMQERYGKYGCWMWMLVATAITLVFNQQLALASATAFFVSEFIDWLIYTCTGGSIKKRLLLSNLISTPIDSLIFVLIAFGPIWPAIWGQTIIKMLSSLLVLPLLQNNWFLNHCIRRQSEKSASSV